MFNYKFKFYIAGDLAFVTWGHHALLQGDRKGAIRGTLVTVVLAIIFTALQGYEYSQAPFTIADSVFGSAFFCSTGLHGLTNVPTKLTMQTRPIASAAGCLAQGLRRVRQTMPLRSRSNAKRRHKRSREIFIVY